MKIIQAIAYQTIKAAIRSKFFFAMLVLLLVSATVIPINLEADGDAVGQLSMIVSYSFNFISVILCLSALWMGSSEVATEIEHYYIHAVCTKPVSRGHFLGGKWAGILALHLVLLLASTSALLGCIHYRISTYSEAIQKSLEEDHLVARRKYEPVRKSVDDEAQRRVAEYLKANDNKLPKGTSRKQALREARRKVNAEQTTVSFKDRKLWKFEDVDLDDKDKAAYLEFRIHLDGDSDREHQGSHGLWSLHDSVKNIWLPQEVAYKAGVVESLRFDPKLIAADGTVNVEFENRDWRNKTAVFTPEYGPFVLVDETTFSYNYWRAVLLVAIELAFFVALGCTAGAMFSSPVAIFFSFSYLFIGSFIHSGVFEKIVKWAGWLFVSPQEMMLSGQLNEGILLTGADIAKSVAWIGLRGGLVACLGIGILIRRELANVQLRS